MANHGYGGLSFPDEFAGHRTNTHRVRSFSFIVPHPAEHPTKNPSEQNAFRHST